MNMLYFVGDDLVINKWFAIQAGADHDGVLDDVKRLKNHELFMMANPNRMRSLIGTFSMNPLQFHRVDGDGYRFVANCVAELDKINGRSSATIAKNIISWKS